MNPRDEHVIILKPKNKKEIQVYIRDSDTLTFLSILNREISLESFTLFGVDIKTTYLYSEK